MDKDQDRKNSLLFWASSLPTYKKYRNKSQSSSTAKLRAEDFEDVILIQEILKNDIDSVYFFTNDLNNNNHSDQSFITPLAFLIDKMKKYYAQQEGGHLIPLYLTPSSAIISLGGGNTNEISRLLQLLLVCAVNCPNAKKFSSEIKRMDQKMQTQLMSAIIELTASTEDTLENTDQLLGQEINLLNNTKEELTLECLDLRRQLLKMTEGKENLVAENERLKTQLKTQNDHERSLNNLNHEHQMLKNQSDKVQITNTLLQEQVQSMTKKIIETETKEKTAIENARQQNNDALEKQHVFEKEFKFTNHDLKTKVEKLETLNEKLEKEKLEMNKTMEILQLSHKHKIDNKLKENEKLSTKILKLEQDVTKFAGLEKETCSNHQKEMKLVQLDLERLKRGNKEKISKLEEDLKQLQLKNSKLEEQLKFDNREISRLSTDHGAISERKLELEKASSFQERERKLLTSTFYNYGMTLERYVVEQRRNNDAISQNPNQDATSLSLLQLHRQRIPQRFPIHEFHTFEIEEGAVTPKNPDIFYL